MMNLSFRLRELKEYCTPKGPEFGRARKVSIAVEGSQIRLCVPRHRSSYKSREARQPKSPYTYERMIFRSSSLDIVVDESWKNISLLFRSWAFNGDWFTGSLAELSMSLGMAVQATPKAGVSFFHPRAFEQVVGDYLTNRYSKDKWFGHSEWLAPVNWKPLTGLPCIAVYLEVTPDPEINPSKPTEKYVFFPLDDQHFVFIKFGPRVLTTSEVELINPQPMEELMNDIINSLEVNLSPSAQAQQTKALAGLEDTALITTFPPMKWTTPEQDAEWEEYKRTNEL